MECDLERVWEIGENNDVGSFVSFSDGRVFSLSCRLFEVEREVVDDGGDHGRPIFMSFAISLSSWTEGAALAERSM